MQIELEVAVECCDNKNNRTGVENNNTIGELWPRSSLHKLTVPQHLLSSTRAWLPLHVQWINPYGEPALRHILVKLPPTTSARGCRAINRAEDNYGSALHSCSLLEIFSRTPSTFSAWLRPNGTC